MTLENEVALEPSEHWGEHPPGTAQSGAGAEVAQLFPPHRARAWGWGRWPGWPSDMLHPTALAQGTGMDFGLLIQLPPIHSINLLSSERNHVFEAALKLVETVLTKSQTPTG